MMPYLNEEDLSQPKPLMWLLSSGKEHPAIFSSADHKAMRFGVACDGLRPVAIDARVMVQLSSDRDRDSYGQIWQEGSSLDSAQVVHGMCPPEAALLMLEVQDLLMNFLIGCCGKIMHDIPPDQLTADTYPRDEDVETQPRQKADGDESLLELTLRASNRVPTNLSFSSIEALLGAATEVREYRVWAPREDPGFLREDVFQTSSHRVKPTTDDSIKSDAEWQHWHRAATNIVRRNHLILADFSELSRQSQRLQTLQSKHRNHVCHGTELPEEYLDALLYFRLEYERA
jgi:hypothetical protein